MAFYLDHPVLPLKHYFAFSCNVLCRGFTSTASPIDLMLLLQMYCKVCIPSGLHWGSLLVMFGVTLGYIRGWDGLCVGC